MTILKKYFGIILVTLVIFLIRIPSFFEPYWYGDEGIYLAIGQAMNRGAVLYRDIWDNKTPLLYVIYAISPTLLWAKISATLFVLTTCTGVYFLTKSVIARSERHGKLLWLEDCFALLAMTVTGILLSIPLFEGTIANAELYFTAPIVWGAYLLLKIVIPDKRSADPESIKFRANELENLSNWKNILYRFRLKAGMTLVGLLVAFAFLLKVPAILDFVGIFAAVKIIFLFERSQDLHTSLFSLRLWKLTFKKAFATFLPILFGFSLPVLLTFGYFVITGSLSSFLTASFFQNASYVSVDSGPLTKLTNPLIVRGLILVAGYLLLVTGYLKKVITKELFFLAVWFGFSLYGALLSNRPYMHYLLQIAPPATILVFYLFSVILNLPARRSFNAGGFQHLYNKNLSNRSRTTSIKLSVNKSGITIGIFFIVLAAIFLYLKNMFTGAFSLGIQSYYQNWFDYVSERKTWEEYVTYFDSRTLNSYHIAKYLIQNTKHSDNIFVWADASFIYVLSNLQPSTKFIQAHHLSTIDPKNYDMVIDELKIKKPKFIIIERPVHFAFPKLEELVKKDYQSKIQIADKYIYEITPSKSL